MAPFHDRMPMIQQPAQYDTWLDPTNQDSVALQVGLLRLGQSFEIKGTLRR